jgi:lysophospholipase L1-like esterase
VDTVLASLDQSRPDGPVLVTITIGANDFYFADPATLYALLYGADEATFRAAAEQKAQEVQTALAAELGRLLVDPAVRVVVTEPINPFNRESVFFLGETGRLCRPLAGDGGDHCYARMEYGLDQLTAAERGVLSDAGQPARVAMTTGLREGFAAHAAPRPSCGRSKPDVADTWIQYRNDPASNSRPTVIPAWIGLAQRDEPWIGDCVHPNAAGARAYAAAVVAAALPLLPSATT